MTAYFSDPWLTIHEGDCRAVLREMEPESDRGVVQRLRREVQPLTFLRSVEQVMEPVSRRAPDLNAEYLAQCLARNAQTPLGLESA